MSNNQSFEIACTTFIETIRKKIKSYDELLLHPYTQILPVSSYLIKINKNQEMSYLVNRHFVFQVALETNDYIVKIIFCQ